MVFHWRLSDSKSPQVSRTLLSILAVFNNAIVSMVSTRSPASKSSRPFNNPLVSVPKAQITIAIIVTLLILLLSLLSLLSFSHWCLLMVFHWNLSDGRSPQVSRTFLSILADLSNDVVWMFSACPPFSSYYQVFGIVLSTSIMIGIPVTFMFHNFFALWQSLSTCLSFRLI